MIMMGIYTGLSLKDVINLKWSNIDLTQNTIKVVPQMSKRIFPIILTIHPKLRSLLLKIDDDYKDEKVLKGVVSKSASAITRILGSIFNEAYKELGRQLDTSKVPSEHFHDLRRKYVQLAMNKVSRQTISPFKGY
jgi:integrase